MQKDFGNPVNFYDEGLHRFLESLVDVASSTLADNSLFSFLYSVRVLSFDLMQTSRSFHDIAIAYRHMSR